MYSLLLWGAYEQQGGHKDLLRNKMSDGDAIVFAKNKRNLLK